MDGGEDGLVKKFWLVTKPFCPFNTHFIVSIHIWHRWAKGFVSSLQFGRDCQKVKFLKGS